MTDVRARTSPGARNGLRYLLYGFGLLLALLTASCGNSIFRGRHAGLHPHGEAGDFTSYIVTIDEIQLTRQDGTVVELPMVNQRVDLVESVQLHRIAWERPPFEVGTYVSTDAVPGLRRADRSLSTSTATSYTTTLYDPATSSGPNDPDAHRRQFDPSNPLVINSTQQSSLDGTSTSTSPRAPSIDYATTPDPPCTSSRSQRRTPRRPTTSRYARAACS